MICETKMPPITNPYAAASGLEGIPDFLIIGAAKSGTTTLANYLKRHPQVYFCANKEPCFFAYERYFRRGLKSYQTLFEGAGENQLCGEGSTDYTRYPQVFGVPERIAAANPLVKLIYLMRHPVNRAYSHYVHRHVKELHPGQPFTSTFETHVQTDPMCIDSSLYIVQIEQYLQYFRREQLLLLTTDELRESLPKTLSRVFNFLGIGEVSEYELELSSEERNEGEEFLTQTVLSAVGAPFRRVPLLRPLVRAVLPRFARENMRNVMAMTPYGKRIRRRFTPPPMAHETRQQLIKFFEPYNTRLEDLLNRRLPKWRE